MNGIDIRKMILDMRSHRMGLIQTADQLRFSYLAIIEGGKRILNKEQLSTMDVLSSYIEEVQTLHRLFKSHYLVSIFQFTNSFVHLLNFYTVICLSNYLCMFV